MPILTKWINNEGPLVKKTILANKIKVEGR